MVILTMDPSFNAMAFCLYDGDRTIYIDKCSCSLGTSIGFDKVYSACHKLGEDYNNRIGIILKENNLKIDKVFSEVPPPVGQFSAGLFALDTYILSQLWNTNSSISEVFYIPPTYVKSVRGGSNNKSESTKLAKYYINEVLKDDIDIVIADTISDSGRKMKGQMNNDKADAFMFMLRVFCKYDILGLRDKVINEIADFDKEVERVLVQR